MSKPVFLHWIHKEMWGILASNPSLSKKDAIKILQKKYPVPLKDGLKADCAACDSIYKLRTTLYAQCFIHCPLDWGERCSCITPNSLFADWKKAQSKGQWELASRFARKIQNLPLSPRVHEFYTVKENSDQ